MSLQGHPGIVHVAERRKERARGEGRSSLLTALMGKWHTLSHISFTRTNFMVQGLGARKPGNTAYLGAQEEEMYLVNI